MTEDEIKPILKKFPFYGKNSERQITVLSSYLVEAPGNNKKDTAEKLNVNRNTINKIENSWDSLSRAEKMRLIDFLRKKYAERHFADPESVTAGSKTEAQTA